MKLSFITWSNDEEHYKGLVDSASFIKDAEFIKIGQEFNSMAKAYNEGLKKATGDIFIFIHQDVRILDTRFPKIVENVCKNPLLGFAGVIGNLAVPTYCWWELADSQKRGWLITTNKENKEEDILLYFGMYNGPARQIDGVLMVTNKRFTFPEELPSVHFVDLWMCHVAEQLGYVNWIFNTVIKHYSHGEIESENFKLSKKIYAEFKKL